MIKCVDFNDYEPLLKKESNVSEKLYTLHINVLLLSSSSLFTTKIQCVTGSDAANLPRVKLDTMQHRSGGVTPTGFGQSV